MMTAQQKSRIRDLDANADAAFADGFTAGWIAAREQELHVPTSEFDRHLNAPHIARAEAIFQARQDTAARPDRVGAEK